MEISIGEYLKNCFESNPPGSAEVTLTDNGCLWDLTVDGTSVNLLNGFQVDEGTIDDVLNWPDNGEILTLIEDGSDNLLGFTWCGVKYPIELGVRLVLFDDSDPNDITQLPAFGVSGYWTLLYSGDYLIGMVDPSGTAKKFARPTTAPIAVPGGSFVDVNNPLTSEVSTFVPSDAPAGQLYYYNTPAGSGTVDDPEYVWEHDGDSDVTRIESPLAGSATFTIGSEASDYDTGSPPVAPEGSNIPSSPEDGSAHQTTYDNGFVIQWNRAVGVWAGPVVIEEPTPGIVIANFAGYSANYAEAEWVATTTVGEGTTTYQWEYSFDGAVATPGGTGTTESITLPDTWKSLKVTLTATDGASQQSVTTQIIYAPPFLLNTLVVDGNGDDTLAAAAYRDIGIGTDKIWDSSIPFATLEAAVTASQEGDTIRVNPGDYTVATSVDPSGLRFLLDNATITGASTVKPFNTTAPAASSETSIVGIGVSRIVGDSALAISYSGGDNTNKFEIRNISIEGFESISLSRKRAVYLEGSVFEIRDVSVVDGVLSVNSGTNASSKVTFRSWNSFYQHGVSHKIDDGKGAGTAVVYNAYHYNDKFWAYATDNHLASTAEAGAVVVKHAATDGVGHELYVELDSCVAQAQSGSNRCIVWGDTDGSGSGGSNGTYTMFVRNFHGFATHPTAATLTENTVDWELSGSVIANKAASATTTSQIVAGTGTWDAVAARTK